MPIAAVLEPERTDPLPHLTMYEGRWVIMWHRRSEYFIWDRPNDFADACRYLKACDGPRLAKLKAERLGISAIGV